MADYSDLEWHRSNTRQRAAESERQPERDSGAGEQDYLTSLLRHGAQSNRAVQRFLQRVEAGSESTEDDVSRRIDALAGGGADLDEGARAQLEGGLSADLSGVRVHTGGEADRLARSVGAMAFTTGQDIFFSEGTYDPYSSEGLRLLAHEVTHTVQQAAGPVSGTPTEGGVSVSDPEDEFEQAAERTADLVVSGGKAETPIPSASKGASSATASAAPSAAVQRVEFPFADMFPEQAYDTPTAEEMEILEEMYRKGMQADDVIPPTQPSPTPAVAPPAAPTPQVPVIEPAPVSQGAPTLRTPPTTAPVVEPPGPVTVRSPGVQPPPPVVEPTVPPTLRSPGAAPAPAPASPTAPSAAPAAPGFGSQLLRYGGGALGVIGGALGLYSGGKEAWNAGGDGGQLSDIGDILHGGLTIGAGGASMAGGVATLMGGTAASAGALGGAVMLGKAGMVLGAGLLGYAGGRLLDQGSDWVGKQVSETGVGEAIGMDRGGDYGISALMGKGAFGVDRAIGTLWGDETKAYNPETDEPTKVDRSYENTLAYKINQWLD